MLRDVAQSRKSDHVPRVMCLGSVPWSLFDFKRSQQKKLKCLITTIRAARSKVNYTRIGCHSDYTLQQKNGPKIIIIYIYLNAHVYIPAIFLQILIFPKLYIYEQLNWLNIQLIHGR